MKNKIEEKTRQIRKFSFHVVQFRIDRVYKSQEIDATGLSGTKWKIVDGYLRLKTWIDF